MKTLVSFLILMAVPALVFAAQEAPPCSSTLDVIKFKESDFEMVGDIVEESENSVTVVPEKGGRITLRRALIDEIQYDAREPEQVSTEQLVDGFTSCVLNIVSSKRAFRVVKVKPEAIYINYGSEEGARQGYELNVYREGDEIVDPETGKLLGREKNLVGTLQIVDAEKDYSKTVPFDTPIEEFREGDTATFLRDSPTLAVAEFTTLDGKESPFGSLITAQVISKLNQDSNLKVVEQPHLGLRLLDRLRGIEADAIIVGTVAEVNGRSAVNLRMVDTSTAAVLHSTRRMIGNPERPIRSGEKEDIGLTGKPESRKTPAAKPADRSKKGKPSDILDRLLRAIYRR